MTKNDSNTKVHTVHDGDYLQKSLPKASNTPPPPPPTNTRSIPESSKMPPPPKPKG